MSNYNKHAEVEFLALGYKPIDECEDDPNKWIQENVMELLNVFAKQGHSGSSAPFCVGYFKKLALFEPLSPLQGTDDEWVEISENTWQNKRASNVFKDGKGRAYDINGKVFREPNGSCYTDKDSNVDVNFPYVPKTEYIDVSS